MGRCMPRVFRMCQVVAPTLFDAGWDGWVAMPWRAVDARLHTVQQAGQLCREQGMLTHHHWQRLEATRKWLGRVFVGTGATRHRVLDMDEHARHAWASLLEVFFDRNMQDLETLRHTAARNAEAAAVAARRATTRSWRR